jgi:hypothetical protein
LIAIRYNDVRDSTNVVKGVVEKYKAAWAKRQMASPDGLIIEMWQVKQDEILMANDIGFTAW